MARDATGPRDDNPGKSILTLELLFSDSEEEGMRQICVTDCGSRPQLARVDTNNVLAEKSLTQLPTSPLSVECCLLRSPPQPSSTSKTSGRLAVKTTIYIKMDGIHQLLLFKGVCYQLAIVSYHDLVDPQKTLKHREPIATTSVPSIRISLSSHSSSLRAKMPWYL